jgi:hypothetical protein
VIAKVCGNCRWHFDAFGAMRDEAKNCLALPYPDCTVVWSLPGARCTIPAKFEARADLPEGGSPSEPASS